MPLHLIDYVVVHELAHLLEMNHSAAFCRVVQSVCPDYAKWCAGSCASEPGCTGDLNPDFPYAPVASANGKSGLNAGSVCAQSFIICTNHNLGINHVQAQTAIAGFLLLLALLLQGCGRKVLCICRKRRAKPVPAAQAKPVQRLFPIKMLQPKQCRNRLRPVRLRPAKPNPRKF